MGPLLLTFALKEEARPFQRLIGRHPGLRVLLTGVGQQNAKKAIEKALADHTPRLVLTCGFAGGLDPGLKPDTVVFSVLDKPALRTNPSPGLPGDGSQTSERCGQSPSPPSRRAIAPLRRDGSEVGSESQKSAMQSDRLASVLMAAGARPARFQCVERIVTTATEKRALRRQTGADAVEMESGVIGAICGQHNIPCATVRVISDSADQDLPLDFNRLSDADQNLHYGKLTMALLKSPGKIGALLRLQKQTQAAAEHLAQVLAKVLANLPG